METVNFRKATNRKKLLRNIDITSRVRVDAIIKDFSLFSKKINNNIEFFPTVLISNISIIDCNMKIVNIDHMWIKANEDMIRKNVSIGDKILATASIGKYSKTKKHIYDYGLYHLDDLSILKESGIVDKKTIVSYIKEIDSRYDKPLSYKFQFALKNI